MDRGSKMLLQKDLDRREPRSLDSDLSVGCRAQGPRFGFSV